MCRRSNRIRGLRCVATEASNPYRLGVGTTFYTLSVESL